MSLDFLFSAFFFTSDKQFFSVRSGLVQLPMERLSIVSDRPISDT
jgi:hypothetical protein